MKIGANPKATKERKKRRVRKQAWMRERPMQTQGAARLQPRKAAVLANREAEATAGTKEKLQMQKRSQQSLTTGAKARGITKGAVLAVKPAKI